MLTKTLFLLLITSNIAFAQSAKQDSGFCQAVKEYTNDMIILAREASGLIHYIFGDNKQGDALVNKTSGSMIYYTYQAFCDKKVVLDQCSDLSKISDLYLNKLATTIEEGADANSYTLNSTHLNAFMVIQHKFRTLEKEIAENIFNCSL
jgi:hypothetical protein